MKISKSTLKTIIKEELKKVLQETRRLQEYGGPDPFGLTDEDPEADLERAEQEARELDRENNPQSMTGDIPGAVPPIGPDQGPPVPGGIGRELGPLMIRKILNRMGPQDLKGYGRNRAGEGDLSFSQWAQARRQLARGGEESLNQWMRSQVPHLNRKFMDLKFEAMGVERGPEHDYIGNM